MSVENCYCGFLCAQSTENSDVIRHLKKFNEALLNMDTIGESLSKMRSERAVYNIIQAETVYEGMYYTRMFEYDRANYLSQRTDPESKYWMYQTEINFRFQNENPFYFKKNVEMDYTFMIQMKSNEIEHDETEEPSEPSDPMEPTEPMEPMEPTEPAENGELSEPLEPDEPERVTVIYVCMKFEKVKKRLVFGKKHIKVLENNRIVLYYEGAEFGFEINWINPFDPIIILYMDKYSIVYKIKEVDKFYNIVQRVNITKTEFEDKDDDMIIQEEKKYSVLQIPNVIDDDISVSEEVLEYSNDILQLGLLKKTDEKNMYESAVVTIDRNKRTNPNVLSFVDARDTEGLNSYTINESLRIDDGKISWWVSRPNMSKNRPGKVVEKKFLLDIDEAEKEREQSLKKYESLGQKGHLEKVTKDEYYIKNRTKKGTYEKYVKIFDFHTGINKRIHYRPINTINKVKEMFEDILDKKNKTFKRGGGTYTFQAVRKSKDLPKSTKIVLKKNLGYNVRRDIDREPTDGSTGFNLLVCIDLCIGVSKGELIVSMREINHAQRTRRYSIPMKNIEVNLEAMKFQSERMRIYQVEDHRKRIHIIKMDFFTVPDILEGVYKLI